MNTPFLVQLNKGNHARRGHPMWRKRQKRVKGVCEWSPLSRRRQPLTNRSDGPTQPRRGVDGQRVAVEGALASSTSACVGSGTAAVERLRTHAKPGVAGEGERR